VVSRPPRRRAVGATSGTRGCTHPMNEVLRGWLPRFVILGGVFALYRYSNNLTWLLVVFAWFVLIGLIAVELLNLHRHVPWLSRFSFGGVAVRSVPTKTTATPVTKPQELATALKQNVFGQDQLIDALTRTLRRRLIAKRPNRPVAVFCFLGPPGVGKVPLAKMLVEALYQDMRHLQVIDAAHSSAATLFGTHGAENYGKLTTALRAVPDTLILIEEFGKAHAEIQKRFLAAWNDGYVTEASDGTAIASNEAIFILTFDTRQLDEVVRDQRSTPDMLDRSARSVLVGAGFQPDVVSRIDEVFVFRELEGLDVARVMAVEIENIAKQYDLQIAGSGIDPAVLIDAINKVSAAAGDMRAVARNIERQIADGLLDAKAAGASHVRLSGDGGKIWVSPVVGGGAAGSQTPMTAPA